MKQPAAAAPKVSRALRNVYTGSLVLFLFSIALFMFFFSINKSIARTEGKIIDKFTRTEAAGRKRTQEREVYSIRYSINGNEFVRKTPQPRRGRNYSRDEHVPVYYYAHFPYLPWFFHKSNSSLVYSSSLLVISTLLFGISWRDIRRAKKTVVPVEAKGRKKQP